MTFGASDDDLLEQQRMIANGIVAKLNDTKATGVVATAMQMVLKRIVASGNSLAVLRNNAHPDHEFDAASILRSIYDVMLQGLYIMGDPDKRAERAALYLDYMDVERKRRIELVDANPTGLAKRVSGSAKRAGAEPMIEDRFEKVKVQYTTKNGKTRDTWYPGTLRDLAKAAQLESEYELIQKWLSGVVHSSPLTLREGPFVRGFLLADWHWRFAFRILGVCAEYAHTPLDANEQEFIAAAKRCVLDL